MTRADGMIWEIDEKTTDAIDGVDAAGRPDPAYAAALGLLRAPFGRRALAALCDGGAWLLLQLPLWIGALPLLLKLAGGAISLYGFVNHPGFVLAVVMAGSSALLTLVLGVVQLVLQGMRGVTIGKAIAGIRSVNVRRLGRPGVGAVLLRYLLVALSGAVPLIGPVMLLLSPLFDPDGRGRGWHDKATGVWLVDVRHGLDPYDEKRMRVARKTVKAEPMPERTALPSLATPVDPAAQPVYRPGSRVSAGVLGVARPHQAHTRPSIGLPPATMAAEVSPGEAGKPVLGGYRAPGGALPDPGTPDALPAMDPPAALPEPPPSSPAAPVPTPPQPPSPPAVHASPVAPPSAAPAPRLGLRLDTGESIPVTEPVLLGRNPDASAHPGARAVPLADDSRSLSKTHLLVRPVEGGLEIVDCGSTNGSGLIRGGVEYGVAASTPVVVVDGDVIVLGDRTASVVRG